MKRPLDGLYDWFAVVYWLERRQLRLNSCHSWSFDQDGILWASQSHHQYSRTGESDYRRGGATSWPLGLNYQWPRSNFHIQVLILALLLPRHQETTLYHVLPSNRRANGTIKQHDGSIPSCLCQLGAEWLGIAPTNGKVCLQQLQKRQYGSHTIRAQL